MGSAEDSGREWLVQVEGGPGYPESQLVRPSEESEPRPLPRAWAAGEWGERMAGPPPRLSRPSCTLLPCRGQHLTWWGMRSPGKVSGLGRSGAPPLRETVCRQSSQRL